MGKQVDRQAVQLFTSSRAHPWCRDSQRVLCLLAHDIRLQYHDIGSDRYQITDLWGTVKYPILGIYVFRIRE